MEYYNQMIKYIKKTKEEFKGAKEYAEMAVRCKENGDMTNAKNYYEMAGQELNHAMLIHSMAVKFINDWKEKESVSEWIMDKWNDADGSYLRHVGKIKYMLGEFAK